MTIGRWVVATLAGAALLVVGVVYLVGPDVPRPGPVVVSVPTTTTPTLPPCIIDGDCVLNGR